MSSQPFSPLFPLQAWLQEFLSIGTSKSPESVRTRTQLLNRIPREAFENPSLKGAIELLLNNSDNSSLQGVIEIARRILNVPEEPRREFRSPSPFAPSPSPSPDGEGSDNKTSSSNSTSPPPPKSLS